MKTCCTGRWLLWPLMATALVCAAALPADKIRLRLQLQEGASFRFEVVVDQTIHQTVMGQDQPMKQQIGMSQQFDVLGVHDDRYDVSVTYHRVFFEQEGPLGLIAYDSDVPPETLHPGALGFAALKGRCFTMTMDALGHVETIDGIDAMLDAMVMTFDSLRFAPSSEMREGLKQQFGDEMMKSQMENMMAIYPEEAVGIGDEWVNEVVLTAGMPMRLTNTYRLVAREQGQATIEVRSTVAPNPGVPIQMGGMALEYAMAGIQQGTLWVDEASGLPRRVDVTQHLTGEVTMNGSMTWPIEIETHNVLERAR